MQYICIYHTNIITPTFIFYFRFILVVEVMVELRLRFRLSCVINYVSDCLQVESCFTCRR